MGSLICNYLTCPTQVRNGIYESSDEIDEGQGPEHDCSWQGSHDSCVLRTEGKDQRWPCEDQPEEEHSRKGSLKGQVRSRKEAFREERLEGLVRSREEGSQG